MRPDLRRLCDRCRRAQNCDFTNAVLRGGQNAGSPHFDYMIESTHAQGVYYFASMNGCSNGQKVAVSVVGSYEGNSAQCRNMGVGSSRIRHCDCDHHLRPTTLIDPCLTGFAEGCLSDMPTDTSCCPGSDASYDPVTRQYVNGGTCISQSARGRLTETATELIELMATNTTAIAVLDALTTCPRSRFGRCQDHVCCMLKEIRRCEVTPMPDDCATSDEWRVYGDTSAATSPPPNPPAPPSPPPPPPSPSPPSPSSPDEEEPAVVAAANSAQTAEDGALSPGVIVGIVLASVAVPALAGTLFYVVYRNKAKLPGTGIQAKEVQVVGASSSAAGASDDKI